MRCRRRYALQNIRRATTRTSSWLGKDAQRKQAENHHESKRYPSFQTGRAVQPSFVVLPGWTYNDRGVNNAVESAVDIFAARLIEAADACILSGSIPIFLTPFPRDAASMTAGQIEPWRKLRQTILEMRLSGAMVLDATSILGVQSRDGISNGSYRLGLSNDAVHPNDAGHAAVSDSLTSIISQGAGITDHGAGLPGSPAS